MKFIQTNRNLEYKNEIIEIINARKKEIFDFFYKEELKLNFNIYLYDTIEELTREMKKRGFNDDPDYMCACFKDEDNSLNLFEPKDNPNEQEWTKEEYKTVIFHELIHAITYSLYGTLPEWLCEGIAKYLDGTYSKGIKWLFENYIHKTLIPKQIEIENEFGKHNYDSYDYAYVMVSYLIETLGQDRFNQMLEFKEILKQESENLLLKAICYYNIKYFGDFYYNQDLSEPQWLFHGSPQKLEIVNTKLSHDSDNNLVNIDNAVFLTSSKEIASAYAFKDSIKENSKGLKWNFVIEQQEKYPIMTMENVCVDDDIEGYIYIFVNDGSFVNEPIGSLQFKSFKNLKPANVIKIKYIDYKDKYKIISS